MRPPEKTEQNYVIYAYSDPRGNDAIRLLLWKKVASINNRLLSQKYHTCLTQGNKLIFNVTTKKHDITLFVCYSLYLLPTCRTRQSTFVYQVFSSVLLRKSQIDTTELYLYVTLHPCVCCYRNEQRFPLLLETINTFRVVPKYISIPSIFSAFWKI